MIIRMRRRVTQAQYLAELANEHGSVERLAKRAKRTPSLRPLVEEWRWLAGHPERNDELIGIDREMLFHDLELFLDVITPQRLRLLQYLREHPETDSLSELARALGRDYRNVHTDAKRLASTGVIQLEPRANRVVPRVTAESIEVEV